MPSHPKSGHCSAYYIKKIQKWYCNLTTQINQNNTRIQNQHHPIYHLHTKQTISTLFKQKKIQESTLCLIEHFYHIFQKNINILYMQSIQNGFNQVIGNNQKQDNKLFVKKFNQKLCQKYLVDFKILTQIVLAQYNKTQMKIIAHSYFTAISCSKLNHQTNQNSKNKNIQINLWQQYLPQVFRLQQQSESMFTQTISSNINKTMHNILLYE
eukprot:TRINITY_DN19094_c0_g1_i3.p1 TRINITY_DN19094_c0_g1~~TRINITY_DN19094_c0_g1_i3.p1  ORF type:complete len:211 (+),score=-16.72 TRINITY_DN19094_c0_g1_i3:61-693(+)